MSTPTPTKTAIRNLSHPVISFLEKYRSTAQRSTLKDPIQIRKVLYGELQTFSRGFEYMTPELEARTRVGDSMVRPARTDIGINLGANIQMLLIEAYNSAGSAVFQPEGWKNVPPYRVIQYMANTNLFALLPAYLRAPEGEREGGRAAAIMAICLFTGTALLCPPYWSLPNHPLIPANLTSDNNLPITGNSWKDEAFGVRNANHTTFNNLKQMLFTSKASRF